MGGFRALPWRLCRRAEAERPFDSPTADIRISLCCIMDSGNEIVDLKNCPHAERSSSVYFMAANGR